MAILVATFLLVQINNDSSNQATITSVISKEKQESVIWTGKIEIDKEEMAGIQKAIDDGHQPWRMDPEDIACVESTRYGFDLEKNYETIKEVYHHADIPGIIKYQVTTSMEKDYIITVIQPVPGERGIWTISEITESK